MMVFVRQTCCVCVRAYFGSEGIGYQLLRVPVAGCDFSMRYYEYDDNHPGDGKLTYFNLTYEDYLYKACTTHTEHYFTSLCLTCTKSRVSPLAQASRVRMCSTGHMQHAP
ncbi:hypothetical protein PR048_001951 [Dryococelus australis]|uniref:Glucosylceramidase n=1 Tax=Dryococelus australis TaxID=614101 RepID=A0ABQ9IIW8_9NEOP|nr:hypothetical protein PR048_001951 [Dryococelus australis]